MAARKVTLKQGLFTNEFKVEEIYIPSTYRARSKYRLKLEWGNIIIPTPNFTNREKLRRWLKNHFPKRKIEKFLTAATGVGRVIIEKIEWEE